MSLIEDEKFGQVFITDTHYDRTSSAIKKQNQHLKFLNYLLMNKKKSVSVKNVIDKILLNKKLNNGLLEIRIKDAWKNVMEKNINFYN